MRVGGSGDVCIECPRFLVSRIALAALISGFGLPAADYRYASLNGRCSRGLRNRSLGK